MDTAALGERILAVRKQVEAAIPLDQLLEGEDSPGQRLLAFKKQAEEALNELLEGQSPGGGDAFAERPEVYVGGAFAGGLVVAIVLRALGPK